MAKYSEGVMNSVRQQLWLEEGDTSRDNEIANMSRGEVFSYCLNWKGIIGFDYTIRNFVEEIFRVKLEK